jgi:hypothetical protein
MARDIFLRWPEFYGDFPTWQHLPMSVSMGANMGAMTMHRQDDNTKAAMALHRGSVASTASAATTTAANGSTHQHSRRHNDRTHSLAGVDHRGPAEEFDENAEELNRRHSISAAPVDAASGLFSVQGFSDWWGTPFQFPAAQQHGHGFGHDKSADFGMPAVNAAQETLNALSQMYDLPI